MSCAYAVRCRYWPGIFSSERIYQIRTLDDRPGPLSCFDGVDQRHRLRDADGGPVGLNSGTIADGWLLLHDAAAATTPGVTEIAAWDNRSLVRRRVPAEDVITLPEPVRDQILVPPPRGFFIAVEGIDGVGKSTQVGRLAQALRQVEGEAAVVVCPDPGTTALGWLIRRILKDSQRPPLAPWAQSSLFLASKSQMVQETIAPALAAGKTVICDRFITSFLVHADHMGAEIMAPRAIRDVLWSAVGFTQPDLSLLLTTAPDAAIVRRRREPDRLERDYEARRRAIAESFLVETSLNASSRRVDATDAVEQVADRIAKIVAAERPATWRWRHVAPDHDAERAEDF